MILKIPQDTPKEVPRCPKCGRFRKEDDFCDVCFLKAMQDYFKEKKKNDKE